MARPQELMMMMIEMKIEIASLMAPSADGRARGQKSPKLARDLSLLTNFAKNYGLASWPASVKSRNTFSQASMFFYLGDSLGITIK